MRWNKNNLILKFRNKTIIVSFDDKEGVLINTYLEAMPKMESKYIPPRTGNDEKVAMTGKTYLVINEQHSLFPEQEDALKKFGEYETIKVPADGWTVEQMREIAAQIDLWTNNVIFASPVPYLLAHLAAEAGNVAAIAGPVRDETRGVWIFHNDNREKKELPGGRLISVTAKEGWTIT